AAALALPSSLLACNRKEAIPVGAAKDSADATPQAEDQQRLAAWTATLRAEGLAAANVPVGRSATRVGELAVGTPYEAFTLEAYIRAGGSPSRAEPLTLSLTRFDCVSLVEACLAVSRIADDTGPPDWAAFGREMERMRYRSGQRGDYASRLHYFSEWISDGEKRGLIRDLGAELGGVQDTRPLRFMTENRGSYPALADDGVFARIGEMERTLDSHPRRVIPTERIASISDRLESGDVLAFATSIPGLDVSHAAFAYRDREGVLRVLHAPLSGGMVEVTRSTLPEYVSAIRRSTGILVARPQRA
ncbi:MAG TPA: N-acetylmuramoyl-L-alanine amidase-like domain-containing protein, partial [Gemmatimonadaceae bacterium]